MPSLHPNKVALIHKNYLIDDKSVSRDSELNYLYLSNINYNYCVSSHLISRVRVWYDKSFKKFIGITKDVAEGSGYSKAKAYKKFVELANCSLGRDFFLPFELVNFEGLDFIYMDFLPQLSYEESLKKAILGPEKNTTLLFSVIELQVQELLEFFQRCENCPPISSQQEGSLSGLEIKKTLKKRISNFIDCQLLPDRFDSVLESLILPRGLVVPDLVNPNIYSGPVLIDNSAENFDWLGNNLSPILNRYRYILLTLMSPPISYLTIGLPQSIYILINNTNESLWIEKYRKLLPESFSEDQHLAMFYLAVAYEYSERFQIFNDTETRILQLVKEFEILIKSFDEFENYDLNLSTIGMKRQQTYVDEQKTIYPPKVSDMTNSDCINHSPRMIQEGFFGFNILRVGSTLFAIRQSLGPVDLSDQSEISRHIAEHNMFASKHPAKFAVKLIIGLLRDLLPRFYK